MKKSLFTLLMLLATCGAAVHARPTGPEGSKPAPRQMEGMGHKRIESFPAVEAKSFRLVVEEGTAEPLIRNFSIYHVNP